MDAGLGDVLSAGIAVIILNITRVEQEADDGINTENKKATDKKVASKINIYLLKYIFFKISIKIFSRTKIYQINMLVRFNNLVADPK
ncbi:hypothetical protein P378_17110 [Desulforamulus profundi]|uniref:Uncharacterized protein n=1 Tax=Desulforamulus profundi TaxID=1383067 RepID=A0A2C6MDK5_9FIRM|nr:hypothetical protein [Desulforamulus profundi]PHJ37366.1 hypothetical protein P378_17110 [Desulforamulus profundi]